MYNSKRMSQLYNQIFSTPKGSAARDKAVEKLSDEDSHSLYEYMCDVSSGKIKHDTDNVGQDESGVMTYAEFKRLSDSGENGAMMTLSKLAMKSPEKYATYRERLQSERDEALRLHNRKIHGL